MERDSLAIARRGTSHVPIHIRLHWNAILKKKELRDYLNRWTLVEKIESEECIKAPVELLARQMLSIWDMSKTLDLDLQPDGSDTLAGADNPWLVLQQKWIKAHASR